MGHRPYRGPVSTLEQAMFADLPVSITCETCGRIRQMHAFTVMQMIATRVPERTLPLFRPIPGLFFCRHCLRRVTVTIRAPLAWTLR